MAVETPPPQNTTRWKFPFYYGWIIVIVVAIAQFTESAEIFPVLGVLMKPMTAEFGWSRTTFTLATSIGTLAGGLAGPLIGPYVDKFGARMILLVSFVLLGAVTIGMAFITELWQFYVIQISARFLALGVISLALSIMIPKWFVKKRARAVALSGLGGRFGNAITPIYVQLLVTAYSWRVATVTTGVVMLAFTLLPVALFVKRQPEDIGLLPDGQTPEEAAKAKAEAKGGSVKGDLSFTLKQVVKMPSFYLLIAGTVFSSIVAPALNLHMVPFFTDQGLSPAIAVAATTVMFFSAAGGSILFGFLADKFGVRRVLTIANLLMAASFLFLLAVSNPVMAIIWGAYQGILQGGSFTLQQVLFADYFGRGSLGTIRGAVTPIQLATNAAGPLMAALAYDFTGNYIAIFLVFAVLRVLSGAVIFVAKPPAGSAADIAQKKVSAGA